VNDLPALPDLRNRNFMRGERPYIVDAIGPVIMTNPTQPLVKLTMTPFRQGVIERSGRELSTQPMIELHVADLMTIGTGSLTQAGRLKRAPQSLFTPLNISLNMAAHETLTFADLGRVFGSQGLYALRSPWGVVKRLQCLVFTEEQVEVLIPCLDAWRFTFACSSTMLAFICSAACQSVLTTLRKESVLETQDGQTFDLPLVGEATQRLALLASSTLHLNVPASFSQADVPTLAWLMTDELAFEAATRFYPSLLADAASQNQAPQTRLCFPCFSFPFLDLVKFRLRGAWLTETLFLTQHIMSCQAALSLPNAVTHDLSLAANPDPPTAKEGTPEPRGRPPRTNDKAEIDSLTPPEQRLSTLRLGLSRSRMSAFSQLQVASRNEAAGLAGEVRRSEQSSPDSLLSAGEAVAGGSGGRPVTVNEEPEEQTPPLRAIDHLAQFCDLKGVCEELEKFGFVYRFIPVGRKDNTDPTTPIPSSVGPAANWVGKGIGARRALIARISLRENVAYAMEWERQSKHDSGKLLLITAGCAEVEADCLLEMLTQCGTRRGVWQTNVPITVFLKGLSHHEPYRTSMSTRIKVQLEELGW